MSVAAARSNTGTTISDFARASQLMCPGNLSTSGTMIVRRSAAAVPHTPRPNAMSRQPSVP